MKWLRRSGVALTVSFVTTMAVLAVTFVWLMFTYGDESGERSGLFGSVFFEARDKADGATEIGFGVVSATPIVIVFLVSAAFILAVFAMLDRLKIYKKGLVHQG